MLYRILFLIQMLIVAVASPVSAQTNVPGDEEELNAVKDEAQMARDKYLQELAAKNKVDSKAADFLFRLRNGEEKRLHEMQSDLPILLLFYNPDCHDCHRVINQLASSDLPSKLTVLAIDAEDDEELFEETKEELPSDWNVGFAVDPIDEEEIYVLLSTPTLFLLSPDKTVLLKDTSLSEISRYLESEF